MLIKIVVKLQFQAVRQNSRKLLTLEGANRLLLKKSIALILQLRQRNNARNFQRFIILTNEELQKQKQTIVERVKLNRAKVNDCLLLFWLKNYKLFTQFQKASFSESH